MGTKQKAFTLIELLVVIAIIGLLSSIVLVASNKARESARIKRSLLFGAQINHAIRSEIAGEWKFENNLNDTSGNNNNGSWQGGGNPVYVDSADNNIGKALSFDGINDYVDVAYNEILNITEELTVEFWIKAAPQNSKVIVWREGVFKFVTGSATEPTKIIFVATFEGGPLASVWASDVLDGRWHHIAGTFNSSEGLILYVDGVQADKNTAIGGALQNMATPLQFGDPVYFFNGSIDEVRIYEQALTSTSIKTLYTEGVIKRGLLTEE